MIKLRNLLIGFLALVVAMGALAGSWVEVVAGSGISSREYEIIYEKKVDIALGQAGVFMPRSAFSGTLELTRMPARSGIEAEFHPKFITRWLEFRVYNLNGAEQKIAYGLNYIYFQSNRVLKRYFDEGNLMIYRYDEAKKDWIECPTTIIEKGSKFRAVCIAPTFGVYGLATK